MIKKETSGLLKIIETSIKEVGITHFHCTPEKEKVCPDRNVGKFPEKYLGHRHCYFQIPYIRTVSSFSSQTHRTIEKNTIQLINICEYTITEYWKK
jgi:hypothetical protein